jgi:hypothetical protein
MSDSTTVRALMTRARARGEEQRMGRFDLSPEIAEEYRGKFRDAVQPKVGEEVLAVGTFRTTGAGTKYAISKTQAGALACGAASLFGNKRAGGLPGQFLLAVTPTRLQPSSTSRSGTASPSRRSQPGSAPGSRSAPSGCKRPPG